MATLSAFISIPAAYLAFRLERNTATAALICMGCLHMFGTLLFVLIARYMKKLLNMQFAFHSTDRQINLMIMANVVSGALALTGVLFPPLKASLGLASMIVIIFQGVAQIQFGYKLQQLPDNLDGILKPFCYSNIATGICIASVVFIIVAVVVSAISDLMIGTIFFNVAMLKRKP